MDSSHNIPITSFLNVPPNAYFLPVVLLYAKDVGSIDLMKKVITSDVFPDLWQMKGFYPDIYVGEQGHCYFKYNRNIMFLIMEPNIENFEESTKCLLSLFESYSPIKFQISKSNSKINKSSKICCACKEEVSLNIVKCSLNNNTRFYHAHCWRCFCTNPYYDINFNKLKKDGNIICKNCQRESDEIETEAKITLILEYFNGAAPVSGKIISTDKNDKKYNLFDVKIDDSDPDVDFKSGPLNLPLHSRNHLLSMISQHKLVKFTLTFEDEQNYFTYKKNPFFIYYMNAFSNAPFTLKFKTNWIFYDFFKTAILTKNKEMISNLLNFKEIVGEVRLDLYEPKNNSTKFKWQPPLVKYTYDKHF